MKIYIITSTGPELVVHAETVVFRDRQLAMAHFAEVCRLIRRNELEGQSAVDINVIDLGEGSLGDGSCRSTTLNCYGTAEGDV